MVVLIMLCYTRLSRYIRPMFAKKTTSPPADRGYQKELEYLRARKLAIDGLIQSLEDYDRFRGERTDNRKRKIA
jgi:hypothetical protein